MHILHVYKDYFPVLGGMENHVRTVCEGLAARGHHMTVLASNTRAETTIEQRAGVRVIKAAQWLRTASTPLSPGMVWHGLAETADIIHLHHPFPPGDLMYWLRKNRPPLVISYHSDIVRQQRLLRMYRPLMERTLDAASRILATSPQYIASSPWLSHRAHKTLAVPLSVDAARFQASDPSLVAAIRARCGGPTLLFVGRLRYYKGLHFLIDALAQLPEATRLLLVGIGPEEQALRQQAIERGVAERIIWAGEVSDAELPSYFAASDVFVLPAHLRAEAFGIVQLEALAAGLPIVSTELGTGTSYVNVHGQTGFVVPPADPQALARALAVLLANPEVRAAFGAAGKERALTVFSPEQLFDRIEDVYRSLC